MKGQGCHGAARRQPCQPYSMLCGGASPIFRLVCHGSMLTDVILIQDQAATERQDGPTTDKAGTPSPIVAGNARPSRIGAGSQNCCHFLL